MGKLAGSLLSLTALNACNVDQPPLISSPTASQNVTAAEISGRGAATIHPEIWPELHPAPLDPAIELRIDAIMARMSVEQKVGQTIQADSASITPDEIKQYRLGSVLSGGNSAPGPMPYADTAAWLDMADQYYAASVDPEGVDVAIPVIWGIDAVHGHANLLGATIFPHNIGLGAANDPDLIEQIMEATARELIVSGHDWTFAPTLAVPRDDRWGRSYEGFAETPTIVASYADRIVEGLQGEFGTDEFMGAGRIISSAKHFIADGGTEGGVDQGDARISEEELRDIHATGYLPALDAQVQSVMISFSSWQNIKMTGNKALITDVLKGRLGFNGFVISDWNAHGQIPGCTNLDCPEAFEAGIDMFMAPDTWKGLYESQLAHVRSGRISMERLDDAVRRILRVKLRYGLFEMGAPSTRPDAGNTALLAQESHRAIARDAVRKSLVLLKNNNATLPLDASRTILVVGDGANSIAKASGGWTLSWQGGSHTNDEFPNGQTILDGILETVEAHGGTVIFDPEGTGEHQADAVIAVYGEDAYAEFQGDRDNVDFEPNGFDTANLVEFKTRGMPVVSVFLSGRPLWANPEINASDAFVAAWLPGSEGGGIADMLFRTDPTLDFTGRLSFSWPKSAVQTDVNFDTPSYDPLFAYGYGLSYASQSNLASLVEDSGLDPSASRSASTLFAAGQPQGRWSLYGRVNGTQTRMTDRIWDGGALTITPIDRATQEDSMRVTWREGGPLVLLATHDNADWSRESNGAMELAFRARGGGSEPTTVSIGMTCSDREEACVIDFPVTVVAGEWQDYRISLSCFADRGVDMSSIGGGFTAHSNGAAQVDFSDIRLDSDTDATRTCGDIEQ